MGQGAPKLRLLNSPKMFLETMHGNPGRVWHPYHGLCEGLNGDRGPDRAGRNGVDPDPALLDQLLGQGLSHRDDRALLANDISCQLIVIFNKPTYIISSARHIVTSNSRSGVPSLIQHNITHTY
jgi:hypothetical protein